MIELKNGKAVEIKVPPEYRAKETQFIANEICNIAGWVKIADNHLVPMERVSEIKIKKGA